MCTLPYVILFFKAFFATVLHYVMFFFNTESLLNMRSFIPYLS